MLDEPLLFRLSNQISPGYQAPRAYFGSHPDPRVPLHSHRMSAPRTYLTITPNATHRPWVTHTVKHRSNTLLSSTARRPLMYCSSSLACPTPGETIGYRDRIKDRSENRIHAERVFGNPRASLERMNCYNTFVLCCSIINIASLGQLITHDLAWYRKISPHQYHLGYTMKEPYRQDK